MIQKVNRGLQVTLPVERKRVLEELQDSYAKLSDNTYADLPEDELLELLDEARRRYREERRAKAQTTHAF